MTCEEFQRMIVTDPVNATRAEISAVLAHRNSCEPCRKIMTDRSKRYQKRASPAMLLADKLIVIGLTAKFLASNDPEAPPTTKENDK